MRRHEIPTARYASARLPSTTVCSKCAAPLAPGFRFCPACGASAAHASAPVSADPFLGRTIGGAYVIRELAGVGGMGRVYRAEQTSLGRSVAVKLIHPHLLSDEQTVARFYREARAASALNHPNSVGIIDFGRADDGVLYLVMEFLQGRDLADAVASGELLAADRACRILIDVLAALAEAHASGVVHRDLKPENIFIEKLRTGRDLVKVVDFGIASLASERATSGSTPGLVVGTPEYLSPEQIRGEPADARSDIYAAGVVLFELLTGRVPFTAETPTRTALAHLNAPAPDPRRAAPGRGITDALAEAVLRALAKDADARFQHAGQMAEALLDVVDKLEASRSRDTPVPAARRRPGGVHGDADFVGRVDELSRARALLDAAHGRVAFVEVVGEVGGGKTRFVREAFGASAAGRIVVEAGPHDSLAPVAYWPVRRILRALHATDDAGLGRLAAEGLATDAGDADAFARAGIREVLEPGSLPSSGRGSPVPAVARALAAALRRAVDRAGGEAPLAVLVLDDAHLVDGSSLAVLKALPDHLDDRSVLVCAVGPESFGARLPEGTERIVLEGFSREEAYAARGTGKVPREVAGEPARRFLPLHVEQLRWLGLVLEGTSPSDLASAVSARVQRLGAGARRLLQSAAVLGLRCTREALAALAGKDDFAHVEELLLSGLVRERDGAIEIAHGYVRDLVEASIPLTTRREFHARALERATEAGAPIEVRAAHGAETGHVLTACVLLEQVGVAAERRGDDAVALLAFRRGWELARAAGSEAAHPVLQGAMATMSVGLARALEASGDAATAEGILHEQVELADPIGVQRAALTVALGSVALRRGRVRDAQRLLGRALEIAREARSLQVEASAHAALGQLKAVEGDLRGAVDALLTAHELLRGAGSDRPRECEVALRLGETLERVGDLGGAASVFSHAERVAREWRAYDLAGRALVARAWVERARRNAAAANECLRQAIDLATQAGDLELFGLAAAAQASDC